MWVLHVLGSNGSCQLGLGHDLDVDKPTRVELPGFEEHHRIAGVASGGNHTLVLRSDGAVYGAGRNAEYQLGLDDTENVEKFRLLDVPGPVSRVAAGWSHSILVTRDGAVYTTGYGDKGELGQGPHIRSSLRWKTVHIPPEAGPVIDVVAGPYHTVAICGERPNCKLVGWGAGRKGQLGSPAVKEVWTPRILSDLEDKYDMVACGRDFTVLGRYGQPSLTVIGSDRCRDIPDAVKAASQINIIEAGWSSVHVMLGDGTVVGWGNDSHGQLLASSEKFETISAGTEHYLATRDLTAYGWGWGEHGNIGPGTLEPELEASGAWKLAETTDKLQVVSVHGGYANSWIVFKK